jgi:transcriptional regulator with XRE-family HTH domain
VAVVSARASDGPYTSVRALGWELARERRHRELELHELARAARVVPSHVTNLELGLGATTLNTVYAVVRALELELTVTTEGFYLRPALKR